MKKIKVGIPGRDWLQVNVQPFILFYLHQMKSGHNRFSPWGWSYMEYGVEPSEGIFLESEFKE